jgi:hypothetical protein
MDPLVALTALVLSVPAGAEDSKAAEAQVADAIEPFKMNFGQRRDEPSLAAVSDGWRGEFIGWLWVVGMDGDIGVRGQSAEVDASFSDILDESDSILALQGRIEVGKGRWGVFIDGMYSSLGADDQTGPGGLADVDVTFDTILIDFGLTYRLAEWEPEGGAAANRRDISIDLYGGGRYTDLEMELDPALLPASTQGKDWIDPIVGAKLVLPIAEDWHLMTWGDIGGFGVESDFTWSATGVIGYDFTMFDLSASLYAGYRALGQDYSEGSGSNEFVWDMVQHGPIVGLSISF